MVPETGQPSYTMDSVSIDSPRDLQWQFDLVGTRGLHRQRRDAGCRHAGDGSQLGAGPEPVRRAGLRRHRAAFVSVGVTAAFRAARIDPGRPAGADARYPKPSRSPGEWRLRVSPGSHSGMARRMNSSNIGTVNAVSPCAGLQTLPLRIKPLRRGPTLSTVLPGASAVAPDRWGPAPSSAIALE